MFSKPQDYDNVKAQNIGENQFLPAGGYICKIVNAELRTSKTGNEMLVLSLDIADGDFKDYFKNRYNSNTNENKRWGCTYYQLTQGKSTPFLKGLISSIEQSNNFTFTFGENAVESLKNKLVGVIFGEEEYVSNLDGQVKTTVKPRFIRSVDTIKSNEFTIPSKKEVSKATANNNYSNFTTISETIDDDSDLPF